jgi:hypothetical protein
VLAVELARQGKRVLLLEGGGPGIEEDSQDPYKSEIAGLNRNGIHVGRFRASGGSTTRWGGQILELDEWDFEDVLGSPAVAGRFPSRISLLFSRVLSSWKALGQSAFDDDAVWREIGLTPPQFREFESFFSRWCPDAPWPKALSSLSGCMRTQWPRSSSLSYVCADAMGIALLLLLTGIAKATGGRQFTVSSRG